MDIAPTNATLQQTDDSLTSVEYWESVEHERIYGNVHQLLQMVTEVKLNKKQTTLRITMITTTGNQTNGVITRIYQIVIRINTGHKLEAKLSWTIKYPNAIKIMNKILRIKRNIGQLKTQNELIFKNSTNWTKLGWTENYPNAQNGGQSRS